MLGVWSTWVKISNSTRHFRGKFWPYSRHKDFRMNVLCNTQKSPHLFWNRLKTTCTAAVEVRNADLGPHADHFCKMVLIWFSFAVTGPHLHEKRWWTAGTCSSQFSTQHTTIHCSAVHYSQGTRDIKRLMAWYHCYPESFNKSGKSLAKPNTNSMRHFFTSRVQFRPNFEI